MGGSNACPVSEKLLERPKQEQCHRQDNYPKIDSLISKFTLTQNRSLDLLLFVLTNMFLYVFYDLGHESDKTEKGKEFIEHF
jgi:hypothetical protein